MSKYIYYKSDFEVTVPTLKDGDGNVVTFKRPFRILIKGSNSSFECSYDGSNYMNCAVSSGVCTCYVDHHGFGCSAITGEYLEYKANTNFSDSNKLFATRFDTDIRLWLKPTVEELSNVTASASTDFTKSANYIISTELNLSSMTLGKGSKLTFTSGGKLIGTAISGEDIVIVPNGDDVCFSGCTFSGSVVDSYLKATNFGAVSDMTSSYPTSLDGWTLGTYRYTYKNTDFPKFKVRGGTDNASAFTSIASFLTNSKRVDMNFNGDFYVKQSGAIPPRYYFKNTTDLVLHGGTLIPRLTIQNSTGTEVYGISFVGFHELHDFPAIYSGALSSSITINGTEYTAANAYNADVDGTEPLGLAGEGIVFYNDAGEICSDLYVHDCSFEMRLGGVYFGVKSSNYDADKYGEIKDCSVEDCTASHIYYQPYGFHASNVTLVGCSGDYCLQGIDFSTLTNNASATNCVFHNCYYGPKQDFATGYRSYCKQISLTNCSFSISDKYLLINLYPYLLSANDTDDVLYIKGCTFNMSGNRYALSPIQLRGAVSIEDCCFTIESGIQSEYDYAMSGILSPVGASNELCPDVEFRNTDFTINSKIYQFLSETGGSISGKEYKCKWVFDHCKFSGDGSIVKYYTKVDGEVVMSDCDLLVPSNNICDQSLSGKYTNCNMGAVISIPCNTELVTGYEFSFVGCLINNGVQQLFGTKTPTNVTVTDTYSADGKCYYDSNGVIQTVS